MKRAKRIIWRDKTYGFHPWRDQVDAIDQLVKKSGTKEAIVIRKLIDEALAARSRQAAHQEGTASDATDGDILRAIQALLIKLVDHAEKSMRIEDVALALLQDTLAEARAGRKVSWEHFTSKRKERGLTTSDLCQRFDDETAEARDFAYTTAKELKDGQTS